MSGSDIKTPIYDFINEYAEKGMTRFHMPGHKGRGCREHGSDITEISGADSLYEASGIIALSEETASALFGTYATFYSVEGSSQAVRAMLALIKMGSKNDRCTVLAARNSHRSFITAAALLDLDVEWMYPDSSGFSLCSCILTPGEVKNKLEGMKDALPDAVYVTSPDYLGEMQDIKGIAEAAHEYGVPLLVDNAHGAYLHFLEKPLHPMDLGADLCCDSAHKTLPALTGCAYLHIGKDSKKADLYKKNAKKALSLFGSTSPSYILMSSLDRLNPYLAGNLKNDLAGTIRRTDAIKTKLKDSGWTLCGSEPLKITIETAEPCGYELAQSLREKGIECEYADPEYVVLMVTPFNNEEDFRKLEAAMEEIPVGKERGGKTFTAIRPEKVLSIREAMFAGTETVPAAKALGRILSDAAISCPPAVPVVVSGERIEKEAIEIFDYYGIKNLNVVR